MNETILQRLQPCHSGGGGARQMTGGRSAKWPAWVRPSGQGWFGQVASDGSAKWPAIVRPSGRRSFSPKWPAVVQRSGQGWLGQMTGGRSAKWPRVARPSGQGSLGQVAATAARPGACRDRAGSALAQPAVDWPARLMVRPSWRPSWNSSIIFFVEGRDVVRLAAGDDALVGDHLLVDPGAAGVADVGPQARPGGQGAAAHDVGLDQHPGCVADRRDRLAARRRTRARTATASSSIRSESGLTAPPGTTRASNVLGLHA